MGINTSAKNGYHNLDEYGFYTSVSKRELFLLLREISLSSAQNAQKDTWVNEACQSLERLKQHGIK